jgi:signal transduction histidine kinase
MTRKKTTRARAGSPREILENIEETRLWIAQGLHDTACQSLCGAAFLAGALEHQLPAGAKYRKLAAGFRELQKGLERALGETREILRLLRPDVAGDLKTSLSGLAEEIAQKAECNVKYAQSGTQPPPFVATQLANIAREILARLSLCRGAQGFSIGFKSAGVRGHLTIQVKGVRFKMPAFETKYPFHRHLLDLRLNAIGGTMEIKASSIVIMYGLSDRV